MEFLGFFAQDLWESCLYPEFTPDSCALQFVLRVSEVRPLAVLFRALEKQGGRLGTTGCSNSVNSVQVQTMKLEGKALGTEGLEACHGATATFRIGEVRDNTLSLQEGAALPETKQLVRGRCWSVR